MKSNIKIVDNFLDNKTFKKLNKDVIEKTKERWSYSDFLNFLSDKEDYQFVCMLVNNNDITFNQARDLLYPVMNKIKYDFFEGQSLVVSRAKLNFFGMFKKNKGMGMHTDLINEHHYYTAIYYLNSNNGGTQIEDGEFIQSKENRLLLFKGQVRHESVVQTDTTTRLLFNINFYKEEQFK